MNVPNISQGLGSAPALPRAGTGSEPVTPSRTVAPAQAGVRTHSAEPGISLTRLACFDINGDGHIDPRSAGNGGDATLLVPTHEVDLPTWSYTVNPMADTRPAKGKEAKPDAGPVAAAPGSVVRGNAAQTNRAVGAYQRYGQTPSAPGPRVAPSGVSATDATPVAPTASVTSLPAATGAATPTQALGPAANPAVAAA